MDVNRLQLSICIYSLLTSSSIGYNPLEVEEEGLYKKSDGVVILTSGNFEHYLFGHENPWFVQFYSSICPHCQNYVPYFKKFLVNVKRWRKVLNIGVINCIKNVAACRIFNITKYPDLRYFHENLNKSDTKGISIPRPGGKQQDVDTRKSLMAVIKEEQTHGRFNNCPSLEIKLLHSLAAVPRGAFVIFEDENQIKPKQTVDIGAEVLLDTTHYDEKITLVLGLSKSPLAKDLGLKSFPALIVVDPSESVKEITPKIANRENFVKVLDDYVGFIDPENDHIINDTEKRLYGKERLSIYNDDSVLLDDLEASLEVILFAEILLHPHIKEEQYEALINIINVLIDYFPFGANGKKIMLDLKATLSTKKSISGEELQTLLEDLSKKHHPIWTTPAKHVKCKGSEPQYRGATCGIWLMLHTMTVAAAKGGPGKSQIVLNALLDYANYFFGCEECAEHFKHMAEELHLLKPKSNKDAILWLWYAHNEVNKRLSGDTTDDPVFPKVQFPTQERCPSCRHSHSTDNKSRWVLNSVYDYLIKIYSEILTSDASKAS